jgi:hypothetical protein
LRSQDSFDKVLGMAKNQAAVEMARLRKASLSPAKRKQIARNAANIRWEKHKLKKEAAA